MNNKDSKLIWENYSKEGMRLPAGQVVNLHKRPADMPAGRVGDLGEPNPVYEIRQGVSRIGDIRYEKAALGQHICVEFWPDGESSDTIVYVEYSVDLESTDDDYEYDSEKGSALMWAGSTEILESSAVLVEINGEPPEQVNRTRVINYFDAWGDKHLRGNNLEELNQVLKDYLTSSRGVVRFEPPSHDDL